VTNEAVCIQQKLGLYKVFAQYNGTVKLCNETQSRCQVKLSCTHIPL